ncbi:MAG: hypothetical protein ABSF28_27620, partial [Terracidiphilus sp.]
ACGGGSGGTTKTPPPTTYTLTVDSTNPGSGATITVSPADVNSAANGTTSFTRTYDSGASVTLTAPATAGGNNFTSWTGCTSASTVTCTVAMSANTTVTANYAAPPPTTYTLTVNSTNPASGVAISVSPADVNSAANGTTSFTRTYDSGASVTLTAPATAGGNNFTSWTGCTSASTVSCTVAMSANTTVTANYATPTFALTVNSTNPVSGVSIQAAPADIHSNSDLPTQATFVYNAGASVTLTAPATAGGNNFSSWTGCTTASTVTCTVALNSNMTVTANYVTPTYGLTVNSSDPTSGVAIHAAPADNSGNSFGQTPYTLTYNAGASVTLTAPATSAGNNFSSWTGCTTASTVTCTVALNSNMTVTANYVTPTFVLTVDSTDPASGVAIGVSPADNNSASNGSTSFTRTYNSGATVTLTAPATSGINTFSSWTGCTSSSTVTCTVAISANKTVTANYAFVMITPTVTVTPSATGITTAQPLTVTVAVSGGTGDPTPTGSVTLTSAGYFSAATTLTNGSATINIAAGALPAGSDVLKATYSPDLASASIYNGTSGNSSAVSVTSVATVTVTAPTTPLAVTDQLRGLNMAVWNDTTLADAVTPFETTGIKAVRWPGGSTSDVYHWEGTNSNPSSPTLCDNGYASPNATFANFVNDLAIPADLDIALTANYGSDEACTGGGDPAEAAAWVANALTLGVTVSHMTVGNEEYGHWEYDLHTAKWDPTTYAAAVGTSTSNGYYEQIKAASPSTLVGVDVDANAPAYDDSTAGWDAYVLANSQYDFVEYHYYAQNPGNESDTYLVMSAAQGLTTGINTIKAELATAGNPDTPIYVGEMGSVSSDPGNQTWSITQGLYAGQLLGEMMNDGVSRATWWIGFGNCNGTSGNVSSSFYGWQDFGAYNIFSDGSADSDCPGAGPLGTLSPTAEAYLLFSNVAVNGETVLTATVGGDTADVRAYAATATHLSATGTALVLFNLNEAASSQVTVTLPTETNSPGVTVITYDKAIYDLTGSPTGVFPDPVGTSTWNGPSTNALGAQTLPLSLTLTPWSMNVVLIQ